jgi:hypothetical protein
MLTKIQISPINFRPKWIFLKMDTWLRLVDGHVAVGRYRRSVVVVAVGVGLSQLESIFKISFYRYLRTILNPVRVYTYVPMKV